MKWLKSATSLWQKTATLTDGKYKVTGVKQIKPLFTLSNLGFCLEPLNPARRLL